MLRKSLGILLLEIEPISGLHQCISFKVNQFIHTLLQDPFHNKRSVSHRLQFSCPQDAFILVIGQNKVTFIGNPRSYNLLILGFYAFPMIFPMLFIEMLQMNEVFFKILGVWKKMDWKFERWNFTFYRKD